MDVAADGDGATDGLHVPLLHEDGLGLLAEPLDLRLREVLALAQVRDLPVQIPVRRHLGRRGGLRLGLGRTVGRSPARRREWLGRG